MNVFRGISAFPLTPTDQNGYVDAAAIERLLQRQLTAKRDGRGVDAVCMMGSTGIYAYLTLSERQRAAEIASDILGEALPLLIGIGSLRTDDAQKLARHAEQIGAKGVLLAPISYTPLTEDEVFQHYVAVASAARLPLCIYNNPSTTHFAFSRRLIERLGEVPNITAIKMPLPADGDFTSEIARLRGSLPEGFVIGYSGDWGCADALLAGADSWFSVLAGLLPETATQLARAAVAGDSDETARLQLALQPLWALFRKYGGLRVMYGAATLLDITTAQPPRPILPLGQADLALLQSALSALEK